MRVTSLMVSLCVYSSLAIVNSVGRSPWLTLRLQNNQWPEIIFNCNLSENCWVNYPRSWWALGHTSATELKLPSCLRWSCSLIGIKSVEEELIFPDKFVPSGFSLPVVSTDFSVTDFFPFVFDSLLLSAAFLAGITVIATSLHFKGPGKWLITSTSALTVESHKTEQGSSKLPSKLMLIAIKSIMEEQLMDRKSSK